MLEDFPFTVVSSCNFPSKNLGKINYCICSDKILYNSCCLKKGVNCQEPLSSQMISAEMVTILVHVLA